VRTDDAKKRGWRLPVPGSKAELWLGILLAVLLLAFYWFVITHV
jgi:hypothetical protein